LPGITRRIIELLGPLVRALEAVHERSALPVIASMLTMSMLGRMLMTRVVSTTRGAMLMRASVLGARLRAPVCRRRERLGRTRAAERHA
jgi:hypothetical protein